MRHRPSSRAPRSSSCSATRHYDRFACAAQAEESELVAHYKGVDLVEEVGKDGQVKLDVSRRPRKKQCG